MMHVGENLTLGPKVERQKSVSAAVGLGGSWRKQTLPSRRLPTPCRPSKGPFWGGLVEDDRRPRRVDLHESAFKREVRSSGRSHLYWDSV